MFRVPNRTARRLAIALVTTSAAASLGGCLTETQHHGYLIPENVTEQVPVGSSREQVLIVLGTPSTTATLDNEVFYYISQKTERGAAFMRPEVIDQRVLAVYLDAEQRVARVAEYGMKDGVLFDFASRTTQTSGKDISFLGQILAGAATPSF